MSSNLAAQLKKLEKSPKFQKAVAEAQKAAIKKGTSFGQGAGVISPAIAKKKAERLRELLFQEVVQVIPSVSIYDIEVGEPELDELGRYVINVGFNRDTAHRESLYGEQYDGIENIYLHMTHGWSAAGTAYGEWHGDRVGSRSRFEGDDFIQRAVDRFNAEQDGMTEVEIDPMYL